MKKITKKMIRECMLKAYQNGESIYTVTAVKGTGRATKINIMLIKKYHGKNYYRAEIYHDKAKIEMVFADTQHLLDVRISCYL